MEGITVKKRKMEETRKVDGKKVIHEAKDKVPEFSFAGK